MRLEDQVSNLELSKKLKELGVWQRRIVKPLPCWVAPRSREGEHFNSGMDCFSVYESGDYESSKCFVHYKGRYWPIYSAEPEGNARGGQDGLSCSRVRDFV